MLAVSARPQATSSSQSGPRKGGKHLHLLSTSGSSVADIACTNYLVHKTLLPHVAHACTSDQGATKALRRRETKTSAGQAKHWAHTALLRSGLAGDFHCSSRLQVFRSRAPLHPKAKSGAARLLRRLRKGPPGSVFASLQEIAQGWSLRHYLASQVRA